MLGNAPISSTAISQGAESTPLLASARSAITARLTLHGTPSTVSSSLGRGGSVASRQAALPIAPSVGSSRGALQSRPTAAVRALSAAASRATVYARDLPLSSILAAAQSRVGARVRPALGIEFGPLWNPANSPGTVAWWNADDLANGAVSVWVDRVGGIGLLQASGVRQPTKATGSFNAAYAGVTFAGVSGANATFLKATMGLGNIPVGTDPRELWGAIDQKDVLLVMPARTAFGYASSVVAGGMDMKYEVPPTSTNPCFVVGDTLVTELQDASVNPFVGPHVVGGRFDAGAIYARIDGSDTNPTSVAITFNTDPNISFTMGGSPNNATIHNWQGVIRHAIVGYYTTADRLRMEGWMAWDCGLQSLLPSLHPYKNAPPLAVSASHTTTLAASLQFIRSKSYGVSSTLSMARSIITSTTRSLKTAKVLNASRSLVLGNAKNNPASKINSISFGRSGSFFGRTLPTSKANQLANSRMASSSIQLSLPFILAKATSKATVYASDFARPFVLLIAHSAIKIAAVGKYRISIFPVSAGRMLKSVRQRIRTLRR